VRGTRKELEGLRHAARAFVRTGDRQQWCEVWIATSPETRALVWPDHPRKMVDAEKVMEVDTTDGLHTIAPRPDDDAVLLRIGVALQKHGAGRREIDTRLLELTDAIRAAFRALTDLQTLDQNARHKLECLARVIDQHFTLGIYLTHSSRFLERLLRND
jgi:hypothetical protein